MAPAQGGVAGWPSWARDELFWISATGASRWCYGICAYLSFIGGGRVESAAQPGTPAHASAEPARNPTMSSSFTTATATSFPVTLARFLVQGLRPVESVAVGGGGRRVGVQDLTNLGDEIFRQTRFGDEAVEARLLRLLGEIGQGMPAQREDRDAGGSLVGLQAARRFPPVHHRER